MSGGGLETKEARRGQPQPITRGSHQHNHGDHSVALKIQINTKAKWRCSVCWSHFLLLDHSEKIRVQLEAFFLFSKWWLTTISREVLIHANIWCQRLKEALICTLMGLSAFVVNATSQLLAAPNEVSFVFLFSFLSPYFTVINLLDIAKRS